MNARVKADSPAGIAVIVAASGSILATPNRSHEIAGEAVRRLDRFDIADPDVRRTVNALTAQARRTTSRPTQLELSVMQAATKTLAERASVSAGTGTPSRPSQRGRSRRVEAEITLSAEQRHLISNLASQTHLRPNERGLAILEALAANLGDPNPEWYPILKGATVMPRAQRLSTDIPAATRLQWNIVRGYLALAKDMTSEGKEASQPRIAALAPKVVEAVGKLQTSLDVAPQPSQPSLV